MRAFQIVFAAIVAAAVSHAVARSLAPNLREALASAGPDDHIPIVILMDDFPEQSRMMDQVRGMTRERRRALVVTTLKDLAQRGQRPLRSLLDGEQQRDQARNVRVLWGVNGVALEASPGAIERLAGNGHLDDTWGWDFCLDSPPIAGTHGTQVAGQVAGDGSGGTVTGMAPDASLMSLGIDCDTASRAWQASDYAIEHGAHVITQSYSWWWTDRPNYAGFRRQTDVELAAGVIHVNSAGNDGASHATKPIPYNTASWIDVDALVAANSFYYRVTAENSGGSE